MIYAFAYVLILAACWLAYRWGHASGYGEAERKLHTIALVNRIDLNLIEQIIEDQGWTITKPEEPNDETQEATPWVN